MLGNNTPPAVGRHWVAILKYQRATRATTRHWDLGAHTGLSPDQITTVTVTTPKRGTYPWAGSAAGAKAALMPRGQGSRQQRHL